MGIIEMVIAFLGGAGGSWISELIGIWKEARQNQFTQEMKDREYAHAIKLAELGQTGEMAKRESEREIAAMGADERAMVASYEHDTNMHITARPDSLWAMAAEIYKTVTRPSLSHLVLLFIAVIWFTTESASIEETITNGILASFAVIIGWWFGDRSKRVADVMFGPGYIRRVRGVQGETVSPAAVVESDRQDKPREEDFPDLKEERPDK